MNKRIARIAALTLALVAGKIYPVGFFRTPTPLEYAYAYSHYPFTRPEYSDCKKWYVDVWGAGLYRTANSAFGPKDGTETTSLASLFFGADSFVVTDALVPGSLIGGPLGPLSLFTLTPNFDYRENTIFFGMNIETVLGCEDQWHVGARLRVPFRSVKTELDCCDIENNNIANFVRTVDELDEDPNGEIGPISDAFAYRLDFLSVLPFFVNTVDPLNLFVQYANPLGANHITMGNVDVTDANNSPVHVISRLNGTAPTFPEVPSFALRDVTNVGGPSVNTLPFLAADGSGLANNNRARFNQATNYTPLGANTVNQSTLWVVPTLNGTLAGGDFDLSAEARAVQTAFNQALSNVEGLSALDLLASNSIFFGTARRNGVGDFDTELYARYDGLLCNGCWFGEGIFGVRFPTSRRNSTPGNLLLVQTGNNRHYEVKLGGLLGWTPIDWFAVKVDAFYHWALRRRESVAAPFSGATVTGIGPAIDAHVSWQYFVGDVDFTFLIPCISPLVGFNVGYQAWVKRSDRVSFDATTAVDFAGVTSPLDETILESRTKRVAHTVKTEIFKQTCNFQLFAGWNHTFAGKNSLKESDWYLGLEVYF